MVVKMQRQTTTKESQRACLDQYVLVRVKLVLGRISPFQERRSYGFKQNNNYLMEREVAGKFLADWLSGFLDCAQHHE